MSNRITSCKWRYISKTKSETSSKDSTQTRILVNISRVTGPLQEKQNIKEKRMKGKNKLTGFIIFPEPTKSKNSLVWFTDTSSVSNQNRKNHYGQTSNLQRDFHSN